jgi:hypothetical protein
LQRCRRLSAIGVVQSSFDGGMTLVMSMLIRTPGVVLYMPTWIM